MTGNTSAAQGNIRVVVADDQSVVREGIVMLLGLLPGIDVVGSARDGEEAVARTAELAPDIVLMDLRMPRCDGVEATRRIRAEHPGTEVVVLTTYADDDSLFAGSAGRSPGLPHQGRGGRRDRQGDTGRAGRAGGPCPRRAAAASGAGHRAAARRRTAEPPDGLTARESEVLLWSRRGCPTRRSPRALHISTATVKTHINNLFGKTGVRDRAQAMRYAYRHGLAQPPGSSIT